MDRKDLEANSSRPQSPTEHTPASQFNATQPPKKHMFRNRADVSSPELEDERVTSKTPLLAASPPRNNQPSLHAAHNPNYTSTLQTGTFHHALIMESRAEICSYLGESLVLAFLSSFCCVSPCLSWTSTSSCQTCFSIYVL
jgi:hypothetical protein